MVIGSHGRFVATCSLFSSFMQEPKSELLPDGCTTNRDRSWAATVTQSVTNDLLYTGVKMLAALCVGWVFM